MCIMSYLSFVLNVSSTPRQAGNLVRCKFMRWAFQWCELCIPTLCSGIHEPSCQIYFTYLISDCGVVEPLGSHLSSTCHCLEIAFPSDVIVEVCIKFLWEKNKVLQHRVVKHGIQYVVCLVDCGGELLGQLRAVPPIFGTTLFNQNNIPTTFITKMYHSNFASNCKPLIWPLAWNQG